MDLERAKEVIKQHGYHTVNEEFMQRCFRASSENAQLRAENAKLRAELSIAPRDRSPLTGVISPEHVAEDFTIDRCNSISPACLQPVESGCPHDQ